MTATGDRNARPGAAGDLQALRRRAGPDRRRARGRRPARWSPWSATTAPASPPWSRRSPGSTRRTSGDDRVGGRAGPRSTGPQRRPEPRHRDRLPGPRAVRQPRRRRQPLPRPRGAPAVGVLDEVDDGAAARASCSTTLSVTDPERAHPGRLALRRPAAVGRDRPLAARRAEGRDPRRADRGARRRADRRGPRPVERLGTVATG